MGTVLPVCHAMRSAHRLQTTKGNQSAVIEDPAFHISPETGLRTVWSMGSYFTNRRFHLSSKSLL